MCVDFVDGISHELKTPITLILETISGDLDLKLLNGQHCQIIVNEAERLTHLVERIFDFAGRTEPATVRFSNSESWLGCGADGARLPGLPRKQKVHD